MLTSKWRFIALPLWLLLWLFTFWAIWTPIQFFKLKIALLVSLVLIVLGAFVLFNRQRTLLTTLLLAFVIAFVTFGLWPAQNYSKPELRSAYVSSLRSYLDTKYVWGGENGRGIDCSGLIRRAMVDALVNRGWQEMNPSLWRVAAQIWWTDFAARDMKESDNSFFQPRFEVASLNPLVDSKVEQGDVAVTRNGVHVLAFVGERTWIQADPNLANGGDKVILTKTDSKNGWFTQKMVICRWKLLGS